MSHRFVKIKSPKDLQQLSQRYLESKKDLKDQVYFKSITEGEDQQTNMAMLQKQLDAMELFPHMRGEPGNLPRNVEASNQDIDRARKLLKTQDLKDARIIEILNAILARLGMPPAPPPPPPPPPPPAPPVPGHAGAGMSIKRYKATKDGRFGDLQIDYDKLVNSYKLEAYSPNGERVINRKVDKDTVDLLNKKFNSKRQYSEKAIAFFNKLTELANLPIESKSKKSKLRKPRLEPADDLDGESVEIKIFSHPDELIKRLEYLFDQPPSKQNRNEMSEIIDKLLELGIINKEQHQKIFSEHII